MSPWGNGPLRAIYRFKWHERIDFDRISPNCCDPVRWHAGLRMDIRRISFTREWSETVTTRFWFTSHFLPDSRPLDCAATFNLAVSTEINYQHSNLRFLTIEWPLETSDHWLIETAHRRRQIIASTQRTHLYICHHAVQNLTPPKVSLPTPVRPDEPIDTTSHCPGFSTSLQGTSMPDQNFRDFWTRTVWGWCCISKTPFVL